MKKILLFLFIPGVVCLAVNCEKSTPKEIPDTRNFIVGIGPVWKNFPETSYEIIEDLMSHINELGEIVLAQTNWRTDLASSGSVPAFFNDLVNVWPSLFNVNYQYVSYGINFFDQQTREPDLNTDINSTNNWTNSDAQAKYKNVALALCSDYDAQYLALALEVNVYCIDGSESDYDAFVEFYKILYDEIKALYPETKVYVTFQLEHMKGLGDASWGYSVDEHWDILDAFDGKLDLVAFTTYPEFEYDTPREIPDDYYSSIISNLPANLQDKPLAFVEIGWSSRSSQKAQVDYLERFLTLTNSLDIEYATWVFMHDQSENPLTEKLNIGLKSWDGSVKKLIWNEWKALKDSPYYP